MRNAASSTSILLLAAACSDTVSLGRAGTGGNGGSAAGNSGATGTADGGGNRFLDITPTGTANRYYLVTASDACGEGSAGRAGSGLRRPMSNGACGAIP